jgi:hypothetical protein
VNKRESSTGNTQERRETERWKALLRRDYFDNVLAFRTADQQDFVRLAKKICRTEDFSWLRLKGREELRDYTTRNFDYILPHTQREIQKAAQS